MVVAVLVRGAAEEERKNDAGSRGRLPPGMKMVGRAPRISMQQVHSMNRFTPPAAVPWPTSFSVTFVTNVTKTEAESEGPWGIHAVKGELFFDAPSQRQRIEHSAGARECVHFYGTSADCALVFPESSGLFALTDSEKHCCLDMPELQTPSANWTTQAKHYFVETRRFKGRMCHGFRYRKDAQASLSAD